MSAPADSSNACHMCFELTPHEKYCDWCNSYLIWAAEGNPKPMKLRKREGKWANGDQALSKGAR